jgi:thiol-disulfide isomerase/thioredoxin
MKKIIGVLLSVFLSFGVFAQEDKKMPEWELYNEAGELVKSSDLLGKPMIIHFWATWCPYCKKLQPGLDRVYKKYQDQGLQMIAISLREDEGATPQAALEERGMSFKTLINGDDVGIKHFGVGGTPTTFFVDAEGIIVGSTTQSDPDDPRLDEVAKFLVENQ